MEKTLEEMIQEARNHPGTKRLEEYFKNYGPHLPQPSLPATQCAALHPWLLIGEKCECEYCLERRGSNV